MVLLLQAVGKEFKIAGEITSNDEVVHHLRFTVRSNRKSQRTTAKQKRFFRFDLYAYRIRGTCRRQDIDNDFMVLIYVSTARCGKFPDVVLSRFTRRATLVVVSTL